MTIEVPNTCPPEPLVSVVTVTYQHAEFIEECVQAVLDQRTDFPVEHLIGEDESTDGTRAICERLARAHPDRIRLFLRSRKDVIHIMGRPTARANVKALYAAARGKYIAVCPGDDHWIDPEKLQRQVDLMEAHPEYSACFTNAWNDRDGVREDYLRAWMGREDLPETVEAADLVASNFIPAATFLFRRDLLYPLPAGFDEAPVSDHLLVLHVAAGGPIGVLDRHGAIRHVHAGGIISAKGVLHKVDVNLGMIPFLDAVTAGKYRSGFDQSRRTLLRRGLQYAVDIHDRERASRYFALLRKDPGAGLDFRERMRWTLILRAPWLADLIKRLKS